MADETVTSPGIEDIAASILNESLGTESPKTETNPDQVVTDAVETLGVAEEASDQADIVEDEDQVSDETIETEESDVNSPDEVESDDVNDDEPINDGEAFYVDYDDVKDAHLPIKIGGEVKHLKFSEIQNQLARAESASKKSQEANQRLEELNLKEKALQEQESALQQRTETFQMNDELATKVNRIRHLNAQLDNAVKNSDSHNATLIRERINKESQEAQKIQDKVQENNYKAEQAHISGQMAMLKEKGYGNIINDNYKSYLKTNLTDQAISAISYDATLAILAEKARKWDASQGKAKRTLKKSKSLPAGGGKINQTKSNVKQANMAKMKAGQGNQDDALAGVQDIANQLLSGNN